LLLAAVKLCVAANLYPEPKLVGNKQRQEKMTPNTQQVEQQQLTTHTI